MKRFISFALACLMLVCFVGCDKEEVNYSFKSGEVGFSVHHDADAVIEKHKVQAEYDWMVRNFTVQEEVPELHHENSYARWLHSAGVCK